MCSRREADKWIEAGRVTCNAAPATLGTQIADGDEIRVDGVLLGVKQKPIYIALNKPVGITCTTETQIDANIIDLIAHAERIFPIGRLDKDSEGLILLTNNGKSSTRSCVRRTTTKRNTSSPWIGASPICRSR